MIEVLRRRDGEPVELLLQVGVADVSDGRELEVIDRDGLHRDGGNDPERAEADHGRVEDVVVADEPRADLLHELLVQHRL